MKFELIQLADETVKVWLLGLKLIESLKRRKEVQGFDIMRLMVLESSGRIEKEKTKEKTLDD